MNRSEKIDVIKCIAIFLVVYGHSLQYGSGESILKTGGFFYDPIFKFIYSFHMPLFMVVTGYLFSFSIKKYSMAEIVRNRIYMFLVPICTWSFIPFVIKLINGWEITIIKMLKLYISTAIKELWFLWAVFYCSLIVMLVNKYMNDYIIIYILGFIITFIITDDRNISLYKYMYPFFLFGYFYGIFGHSIKFWWARNKVKALLVLTGIYWLMFCMFGYDSYIYTSGYCIWGKDDVLKQIAIDIYRLFIGCVGSLMIIGSVDVFYYFMSKKIIKVVTYIGRNSMGIYVFSGIIYNYVLPKITSSFSNINYFIALVESIIVICLALLFSWGIKKYKILQRLFLGGRS